MRLFRRAVIGLFAILGGLLLVGLFLPSRVHVERSVLILAPGEAVFKMANDLEQFQRYSPFMKEDPDAKITWGDRKEGVGASMSWNGQKNGQGTMTIIDIRSPDYVTIDLDFKDRGKAVAFFRFDNAERGVIATWGFENDAGMNVPMRYMGLLSDRVLGKYFERGLADMKEIVEREAPLK